RTKLKSAAILLAAVAVCFGITTHGQPRTEASPPGEPERVTRPSARPVKNDGAADELLGRWWVTRTSAQGKEEAQDGRTGRRGNWIITPTKIIALLGDEEVLYEFAYEVDRTHQPARINLTPTGAGDPQSGKTLRGIFSLEG